MIRLLEYRILVTLWELTKERGKEMTGIAFSDEYLNEKSKKFNLAGKIQDRYRRVKPTKLEHSIAELKKYGYVDYKSDINYIKVTPAGQYIIDFYKEERLRLIWGYLRPYIVSAVVSLVVSSLFH